MEYNVERKRLASLDIARGFDMIWIPCVLLFC